MLDKSYYLKRIKNLDIELVNKDIVPSNLIKIILLALEAYEDGIISYDIK